VNSFVFLARDGYFDGTTFHRVLEGFMAQGGDPTGTGTGGPGYEFVNEDSDLTFDKAGVVAMANAGRDTNGSQFFITFVPTPQLNGDYTIFGQVISGMDVVNGITRRDPDQNLRMRVMLLVPITITENDSSGHPIPSPFPSSGKELSKLGSLQARSACKTHLHVAFILFVWVRFQQGGWCQLLCDWRWLMLAMAFTR
jgi:cyclophilin family peptidyl-prolyl cis-trans isomerase